MLGEEDKANSEEYTVCWRADGSGGERMVAERSYPSLARCETAEMYQRLHDSQSNGWPATSSSAMPLAN